MDGRYLGLRIANDDRRNWHPRRREAERVLPFRCVQEALREADPTGPKSLAIRGEHQVLGSQCAIFNDPRPLRDPGDQDQRRGVIEDLEARIAEHRPVTVGLRSIWQGREHVGLRSIRDPVEQALVANHRERPGLPV